MENEEIGLHYDIKNWWKKYKSSNDRPIWEQFGTFSAWVERAVQDIEYSIDINN